jgi:hypothetical protein
VLPMSRRYHSGEVVKALAAQTAKATEELFANLNAARWNCHDRSSRISRILCI